MGDEVRREPSLLHAGMITSTDRPRIEVFLFLGPLEACDGIFMESLSAGDKVLSIAKDI